MLNCDIAVIKESNVGVLQTEVLRDLEHKESLGELSLSDQIALLFLARAKNSPKQSLGDLLNKVVC